MPLNVVRREQEHLYSRGPVNDSARAPIDALLRLNRLGEISIERVRRATGLSDHEFHAIRYLLQGQRDGRDLGPKDLIVMLGLSSASVTKIVDRLVELRQLERAPHPTDRRAWVLVPTKDAATKITDAYETFHRSLVEALDALPADSAAVVASALNDMADRLEAELVD